MHLRMGGPSIAQTEHKQTPRKCWEPAADLALSRDCLISWLKQCQYYSEVCERCIVISYMNRIDRTQRTITIGIIEKPAESVKGPGCQRTSLGGT